MIKDKFIAGNSRSATLGKVLRLLEELKQTPTGKVIFEHVEHMLADYDDDRITIENSYASLLNILLETYAKQAGDNQELQAQIRSIQLRLNPPLSLSEFFVLQNFLKDLAEKKPQVDITSPDSYSKAFTPLLQAFGFKDETKHEQMEYTPHQDVIEVSEPVPPTHERRQNEFKVNSAYQHHLNKRRDELQETQERFGDQVSKAISHSNVFSKIIHKELDALRNTSDIQELDTLRSTIINELETLLENQESLSHEFDNIDEILSDINAGSRELNEELNRVRLLSMTDELTQLPNRRAFHKRLEEETGRAQRYSIPLTLAILDLDSFKVVNDTYGHKVGDQILKIYAKDVISIFRHHDMVSRYGGEEFAVILPNTDLNGAMRALKKVQQRASKIMCKIHDQRFSLPTFSAGLSEYFPGEDVEQLIHRADTVMYQAKNSGRNAIKIASHDETLAESNHS